MCTLSDKGIKIYSFYCPVDYEREELKEEDGY
jgi:hypothetical protein